MPTDAIKQYLITDTTDYTPAQVMASQPGRWTSTSQVPVYLYTSLSTLWMGASGNPNFHQFIVANSGRGASKSSGYISINPFISESSDASSMVGVHSDAMGAESAIIRIFYALPRPVTSANFNKIANAELRIRHLLDNSLRSLSGKAGTVPINNITQLDIDPLGYLQCIWMGFLGDPAEDELVSEYQCSYIRQVGQAFIP